MRITENNIIIDRVPQKVFFFWLYVKTRFNHTIIYDYKPEKLSKLTGLSVNTIRKYVGILKQNNLCKLTDGHLLFVNRLSSQQQYSYYFRQKNYLGKNISFEDFSLLMFKTYLEKQQMKQESIVEIRSADENVSKNNYAYKKARSQKKLALKLSDLYNWREYRNDIILSSRSLSKKLGISYKTIMNYVNALQQKGLIQIHKVYERYRKCSYQDYLYEKKYNNLNCNFLYRKGWIEISLGFNISSI